MTLGLGAAFTLCALASSSGIDPARNVNVAEFGYVWHLKSARSKPVYAPELADVRSGTPKDFALGEIVQVEWKQPRDIQAVILKGPKLPPPEDVEVLWWYRIWPDNGQGGWMRLDDPFNGEWRKVKADVTRGSGAGLVGADGRPYRM